MIGTKYGRAAVTAAAMGLAVWGMAGAQTLRITPSGISPDVVQPATAPPKIATNAVDSSTSSSLPDAPVPSVALDPLAPNGAGAFQAPAGGQVAPRYDEYIPAGMAAQKLTAHDKVVIGARDLYSPLSLGAMIGSAGYEQLINGAPNYGTNSQAFGKRLGAAALRETSQDVFSEIILTPLFHEDPRYYIRGRGKPFLDRFGHAIIRPIITRNDQGHNTINAGLLVGYAGAAALTPTYYPQINRNFHDVASIYAGSLGGSALGYLISEFSGDVFHALHMSHKQ